MAGRYYNTKALVRQLEGLVAKLPDPSSPRFPEQVEEVLARYRAGATVFELGEHS